jgi:hypothetical protein
MSDEKNDVCVTYALFIASLKVAITLSELMKIGAYTKQLSGMGEIFSKYIYDNSPDLYNDIMGYLQTKSISLKFIDKVDDNRLYTDEGEVTFAFRKET